MRKSSRPPSPAIDSDIWRGFSLVEVLVATAVFTLMLLLLLSITSAASRLWQKGESLKVRRQAARAVLEALTRDLEAAQFPLNRKSANSLELLLNPAAADGLLNRDAIFWQAPISGEGTSGDLQEIGYFVQWITEPGQPPRSELCRLRVPATNADTVFWSPQNWLTAAKIAAYASGSKNTNYPGLQAENVIALWISLFGKNGTNLTQLPAQYSSRSTNYPYPARAEIALAIADPIILRHLSSANDITAHYGEANIDEFVSKLPAQIREGVTVFRTSVNLEGSP